MALKHLLYRCPECGRDPLDGRGDTAWCTGCSLRFVRAATGARVRVVEEGVGKGGGELRPLAELTRAIEARGGPLPAARTPEGSLRYGTEVVARWGVGEEALHYGTELFGFVERLGEERPGYLEVDRSWLRLRDLEEGDEVRGSWALLDLRAVQSSSSALQIFTVEEELVHFRFVDDSPVRWEALLRSVLQECYDREGRGRIVEFQPRITVR